MHLQFGLSSVQKNGQNLEWIREKQDLPLNSNIVADGKYGINLYRANFIPSLTQPRQRYAQCPVQAIVLRRDAFVSPEYITESMPKWVEKFEYTELDANHWLSSANLRKLLNLFVVLFSVRLLKIERYLTIKIT